MKTCKECNQNFESDKKLLSHIKTIHNEKDYYDKWLKNKNEEICKYCNENETIFLSIKKGYKECCCKKHTNLLGYQRRKLALLKKYGVENVFQMESTKNKIKKTFFKKYGVDHQMKVKEIKDKIKQTNIDRTGFSHNFCKNSPSRKKWEQHLLNEENITNVFQRIDVKEKIKQACLYKYGFENAMQNPDVFNKSFKTKLLIKPYKDSNIKYQGSYEKDFLDKYIDALLPDEILFNGPYIEYFLNSKRHVYHTDYFIKPLNLIIEIKSSRTIQLQTPEELKAKELCVINTGYNFLMIINKNYNELNEWIKLLNN